MFDSKLCGSCAFIEGAECRWGKAHGQANCFTSSDVNGGNQVSTTNAIDMFLKEVRLVLCG